MALALLPPLLLKSPPLCMSPHSYLMVSLSLCTPPQKHWNGTDTHIHTFSLSLSCRLVNNTGQSEYRCCWKQPIGSGNVDRPQAKMNEDRGTRGWILWRTAERAEDLQSCERLKATRVYSSCVSSYNYLGHFPSCLIPFSLSSLCMTLHVEYFAVSCLVSRTRNLRA